MRTLPPWVPFTALAVTAVVTLTLLLTGGDAGALPFVLLLAAFLVASHRPARETIAALVVIEASLVLLLLGDVPNFALDDLLISMLTYAAAIAIGWTLQTRRQRIERYELEQAEAARRSADERLRIARELHDVVAHSLGVIAVQAGAGVHMIDTDPEEARHALENISRMSRSSLGEIRLLLGHIRESDGSVMYGPAPGLSDLSRLADEVGRAGVAVDLHVDGPLDDVPPGVGLATYRIVQEALTNTLRHADARRADVRVGLTAGTLEVEVTDDGRGGSAGTGGHGLVGMRERAAVYGGSVEAGRAPTGGFRVSARLPYEADAS